MPSTIRVPLPTAVVPVDPHFRIDIRDPTNGAIGLRVGKVASMEAFERTYNARPRNEWRYDVLFNTQLWATLLNAKLGEISWHVEGLDAFREDLTPPTNDAQFYSQAMCAFIPSGPSGYGDVKDGLTQATVYHSLRPLLADIIACQVVWFQKLLHLRASDLEQRSTKPDIGGEIWRLWNAASPNMNHLDALYIVSIRRFLVSGRWIYFPEVEIRSNF